MEYWINKHTGPLNSRFSNEFIINFTFDDRIFLRKKGTAMGTKMALGVQGWCSGESTRLPPMCPGFDSQIWHQMWVEFVASFLCTERFSPGTPVSPLLKKPKFEFDLIVLIVNWIYSVPNALQR